MRRFFYSVVIWLIILWTVICGGLIAWDLATLHGRIATVTELSDNWKNYILYGSAILDAVVWAAVLVPLGIIALLLKPDARIKIERDAYF